MYDSTPFSPLPFSLFLLSVFKAVIKPPQLCYLSIYFCHNEPNTQLTGASNLTPLPTVDPFPVINPCFSSWHKGLLRLEPTVKGILRDSGNERRGFGSTVNWT